MKALYYYYIYLDGYCVILNLFNALNITCTVKPLLRSSPHYVPKTKMERQAVNVIILGSLS